MLTFSKFITEAQDSFFDWLDMRYDKIVNFKGSKDSVQKWYVKAYPHDSLGKEINPKYTFQDAVICLLNGDDFLHEFGQGDSFVRNNIIRRISELSKWSYDIVYNTYLISDNKSRLSKEQKDANWNPKDHKWKK